MKNLAIAFILLAAVGAGAQDLSQKVTYENSGASAKRVLKELSDKTGVQLETAPQTASEVLVIRVKDVPLTKLMTQIAKVTSGAWGQEGAIYRLGADNLLRQSQAQAELKARTKVIQQSIERMSKPQGASGSGGGPAGDNSISLTVTMGGGDAGSNSIMKLLPFVGAGTLASIPSNGRIVFSTTPTRMQIALPRNVDGIILQLIKDHNKQLEDAQKAQEGVAKSKQQEEAEQFAKMLGLAPSDKPVIGAPSKVLLIAARQSIFDGITLQLRLYDDRGAVMMTASQMIPIDMGMFGDFAAMMDPNAANKTQAPTGPDKDIAFSERSAKVQGFFKSFSNPGAVSRTGLPQDIKDILLHPDRDEPLSFIHGEAVLAVAKENDVNLVASLPDSIMNVFGTFFSPAKLTVNAYLKDLQSGRNTTAEMKDGWLLVQPSKPSEARRIRADRTALAQLLAAANAKGQPTLDDIAAYSLKAEPPMESPASMVYLGIFAPNAVGQGFGGVLNWNMLRLYATLGSTQRQSMAAGAPLSFGNLSAPQRAAVERILFGAGTRLQIEARRQQQQGDEPNPFITMIRSVMPATSRDFRDEPTEIMPNGLPAEGYVTLKIDGGNFASIATGQSSAPSSMYGALGPDEIAMMRYFKEDQQFAAFQGFMPSLDKFRLGNRETLTFKFYAAANVAQTETLRNDRMPENAGVITYDQLPSEFKARIEDRLVAMKKNPIPFGAFMGGGGFKPPAP